MRADEERKLLPHGKAMRLQVGGLRGLLSLLTTNGHTPGVIENVYATLEDAEQRFGQLERLPFSAIMREVAAYQVRRRSGRSRR